MAILDREQSYTYASGNKTQTTSGTPDDSTNVIDHGSVKSGLANITQGVGMPILEVVATADSTGTSPTVQVVLENSAAEGMTSETDVLTGPVVSDPVAGDVLLRAAMPDLDQRYTQLRYISTGTTPVHFISGGWQMTVQASQQGRGTVTS